MREEKMGWKPIATAPRDGTAFLVTDANDLVQVCMIEARPERRSTVRRWFKRVEKVESEAGYYWFYALPWRGGYNMLNMRPDGGFRPTHWMNLDELPPTPQ